MTVFGVILGLIVLTFLVVVHELGHAIVARRNGVVVEEFGIGFPPKAWARKLKNGVLFSINWLPIGGFVKMQGEHDAAAKKGDYGAASFWQKTKILLAGVVMNWLAAAVLLTILALTGLPKVLPNQFMIPSDAHLKTTPAQIVSVESGSPAAKAGLRAGDQLLKFDGKSVGERNLSNLTAAKKGQTVAITYQRDGRAKTTNATLLASNNGKGYLGVGETPGQSVIHATWSAPLVGIGATVQMTGATFQGLGQLIGNLYTGIVNQFSPDKAAHQAAGKDLAMVSNSVSGPLGVVGVLFPAVAKAGPTEVVLLAAIISIGLAVMNVLPIPALDGGRWYTMAVFRVIKKTLTRQREEKIQAVGFSLLAVLMIAITVADVGKIF